ncbi:MAG: glucose-6-phosphate dehydrogenase assembly protein OpcA [Dehalococcoidia bacterium]
MDDYTALWNQPLSSTIGVEDVLAELARQASRTLRAGPAATARLNNLVVVSADAVVARRADEALRGLEHAHPSRLVHLRLASNGPDGVRAVPSVRCHVVGEGRSPLFFESVEIDVGGPAVRHLAEIVAPVLEADLPAIVWWVGQAPLDDPAFAGLLGLVDRLIVDSATFASGGLRALTDFLPARLPISDLAWGRLRGWRDVVATLFDRPPLDRLVRQIDSIEVGNAGASVESRLLIGWLAARLGWQVARPPAAGNQGQGVLVRPGARIPVRLVGEDGSAGVRRIVLVAGGFQATVSADEDGQALISLTHAGRAGSVRHERLVVPSDGATVMREMVRTGRDWEWEAAMSVAASLVHP